VKTDELCQAIPEAIVAVATVAVAVAVADTLQKKEEGGGTVLAWWA